MTQAPHPLPTNGLLQIDGHLATSVAYKRASGGLSPFLYDLSFLRDGKEVFATRGVSKDVLDEAVGTQNADRMSLSTSKEGALIGDQLHYHSGRAAAQHQANAMAAAATAHHTELGDSSDLAALALRMDISVIELLKRLRRHEAEQAAADGQEVAAIQRASRGAGTASAQSEQSAAAEADRQKLRLEVDRQFLVKEGRYYSKGQGNPLVMEDRGHKLVSMDKDPRMAINMAKLAQAKGWNSIKVSGDPAFRREVWIEATSRGLAVNGFSPNEADRAALEARQLSRTPNEVGKGTPVQGRDASTGSRVVRSDRAAVLEAVAAAVVGTTVKNQESQKLVEGEIKRRLDEISVQGREAPPILVYDAKAAAQAKGSELRNQQSIRTSERSR